MQFANIWCIEWLGSFMSIMFCWVWFPLTIEVEKKSCKQQYKSFDEHVQIRNGNNKKKPAFAQKKPH